MPSIPGYDVRAANGTVELNLRPSGDLTETDQDPTMETIGYHVDHNVSIEVQSKEQYDGYNSYSTIYDHEVIKGSLTFIPKGNNLYGSRFAFSGGPSTFNLGQYHNGKYRRIIGCIPTKYTMQVVPNQPVRITINFIGTDYTDWSTTDYIGSGQRTGISLDEPLKYRNFDLTYGQLDDAIESFKFVAKHNVEPILNRESSIPSKITTMWYKSSEYDITLEVAEVGKDVIDEVLNYNKSTFNISVSARRVEGGVIETVERIVIGVTFKKHDEQYSPTGLKTLTLKSDSARNYQFNIRPV